MGAVASAAATVGARVFKKTAARRDKREEETGSRCRGKLCKKRHERRARRKERRADRKARRSGRGRSGREEAQGEVTEKMAEASKAYGDRRGVERKASQAQMAAQMQQFRPMHKAMEQLYGSGGYKQPDYKGAIGLDSRPNKSGNRKALKKLRKDGPFSKIHGSFGATSRKAKKPASRSNK